MDIKRGNIHYIDISNAIGHEMMKDRPVVYIHPQGRYHTVEFELPGGKVRESFLGVGD